jgi:putative membrane protein
MENRPNPSNLSVPPVPPILDSVPSPGRVTLGGFLMGLANLVPGVSGGTMILAVGLYPRFIGAIAELSSLRWSRRMFGFVAFLLLGFALAVLGLAGPAVHMVTHYRWAMYSLFVGMTLGGAPELLRLSFPKGAAQRGGPTIAVVLGFAVMAYIAWALAGMRVPHTFPVFMGMGALAAASMILPGISGSYMLLIFGVYDIVIGSLSASALKEDMKGSLMVIGPVVIGAMLGMAVLSNVLKAVLSRYSAVAHGALLGLLLGSTLGLWPFQTARYPELLDKEQRKELTAQVEEAGAWQDLFAGAGIALDPADAAEMDAAIAGNTVRGELKALAGVTQRYSPSGVQIVEVLGLFLLGFVLVQALGKKKSSSAAA